MSAAKHKATRVVPEEKTLPHLGLARPEFTAELRGLKAMGISTEEVERLASAIPATKAMEVVREKASALGWTEGDVALVRDAIYASSDGLRATGIGLKSGQFRARLLRLMEQRLGQSLLKQTERQPEVIYLGGMDSAERWMQHHNRVFYNTVGGRLHEHFATTVSHCPRTGFALANSFHQHLQTLGTVPEQLIVHEYGIGNGNLSAAFLQRMFELDREKHTNYFSRITMVMCDSSDEILRAVGENPYLAQFAANVVLAKVDAVTLKPENSSVEPYFKPGCVHKMFSNELADTLSAQVGIKNDQTLMLLQLRPYINRSELARLGIRDATGMQQAYAAGDFAALRSMPQFLELVDFQTGDRRAETTDVPDLDVVLAFMRTLPQGRNFSINIGMQAHLQAAMRLLNKETGDGYDLFDTGEIRTPFENLSQVIQAKGDYCFSVNFQLARMLCEHAGFKIPTLEHQTEFVSRMLEPVVLLDEMLETHRDSGTVEKNIALLRRTAPAIRPNYRNIIDLWAFITRGMHNARTHQIKTNEYELGMLYEMQCAEGKFGIKHTIVYLTKPEVEASLQGMQQYGFERERVLELFKHHRYKPKDFVHMKITP